ncbi:MAG: ATP synthase subunit I [Actinomycetota bacterium]|nr:ATP synthase subunit I [Actinomycetota bacterium]
MAAGIEKGEVSSVTAVKTGNELELGNDLIETRMASHMAKWGAIVSPVLLLVSFLLWSVRGLESSAYAIALVLINFLVTAKLMRIGGRISLPGLMVAALGGFIFDLVLLGAAVIPFATASWMNLWALGLTLIVTHLGLVVFEASTISTRMAFAGLRPKK